MPATLFDLPARLNAKTRPELIDDDVRHFTRIADRLARDRRDLESRIDGLRRSPAGDGQTGLERDALIRELSDRLKLLSRFDLDVCLGRMVLAATGEIVYIGRLGLRTDDGDQLLVDCRTPRAEPFFAATPVSRHGLSSRRRYRWSEGRITDYWDESLRPGAAADRTDFIASLDASRSAKMRDVVATIQADQDAIIRAADRPALVIDGGPGTGKTVVALHRAAYLLYSQPRISTGGGLLFVGPTHAYLNYVDDVLPSLGENRVRLCTLEDFTPVEPVTVDAVADAEIKGRLDPVSVLDAATHLYEQPPRQVLAVDTSWGEVIVRREHWNEAFAAREETDHNAARKQVWNSLVDILVEAAAEIDEDADPDRVREEVSRDPKLRETFATTWPILDPLDLAGDLWTVPDYLRLAAPELDDDEIACLQRENPREWTQADMPLIDAALRRIGDPAENARAGLASVQARAEHDRMSAVIDDLIAADDSELAEMTMLRGDDLRSALDDPTGRGSARGDRLAGPFGHIVVDEAQVLTPAQWRMLLDRCPSRSLTIVGDRAQSRLGFAESWSDRLSRVSLEVAEVGLSVNYRTPAGVMEVAEPAIRAVLPQANVPQSVRFTGNPVRYEQRRHLGTIIESWCTDQAEGVACVVTVDPERHADSASSRVSVLRPEGVKGLEFDLVVVDEPESFGEGVQGGVDRYVAMTRATAQLVVLTQ
ncbi:MULTISPECIES: RNA polymerase recycling motor ATPase HelR [unclassified Brevibacterium]|uniref:RNA polymerase recycling motor ATPase HelR n=1 Tax=unclassified Brevibacterium TaxID=2614124 RepID=UPI001E583F60|nr:MULTISPECIES: RNA polymerase recycling motor ATPase HelR [unclassified Brevibacterium]MDK8435659.1 RNA polymerase recycling motor ATPase HelR [Brevibacterium sp. H-BE7]